MVADKWPLSRPGGDGEDGLDGLTVKLSIVARRIRTRAPNCAFSPFVLSAVAVVDCYSQRPPF